MAIATRDKKACTVARCLMKEWFSYIMHPFESTQIRDIALNLL